MKIRVGLIGLGPAWESRHRSALMSLADRFEVRAVCAEVAERAHQVACDLNAQPVDGFRALVARPDIDAVLILSTGWHGAIPIVAACQAGKAVYCASVLDINLDEADEVRRQVERSGVAFMAEFPRRCAPATVRLKELIATRLGPPQLLFCHNRVPGPNRDGSPDNGRKKLHLSRELLELVDWCTYVVGRHPTMVSSVAHHSASPDRSCDYQMMSLDFSPPEAAGTGALAQISNGSYIPARWREAITFRPPAALQVACEKGVAFVDLPSTLIWFDDAGRHMESLDSERPVGEQLLRQFHRSVTSLVRRLDDLEDAYRALRILRCAETSCREGRRVALAWPAP